MCPGSPSAPTDSLALAHQVKARAKELGFDLCGIARAEAIEDGGLAAWMGQGYAADMGYMKERSEERLDPRRVLPGARSVVVVASSYWRPGDEARPELRRVARYARGRDYHLFLRRKVRKLRRRLLELCPGARAHPTVDTSPVMEKVWAQRAGLGWIGKNGLLIAPPFGSWVLLGTILTDAELAPDPPHPERCGRCEACLPACPTGALKGAGQVDSRLCIAYWTIETRGSIPAGLREACADHTFGCDACQDACPWNREAEPSHLPDFAPFPLVSLRCSALAELGESEYEALGRGSPLRRPGRVGLRRNATLGLLRQGGVEAAESCRRLRDDPSPEVREAAAWVLERLPD
jgi:epoxyqueuosine reductase